MRTSKKPHRVVTLLENNPYPNDISVNPHMEALVKAGYQVTVISPRNKGQARHEVIRGVEVYRIPIPTLGSSVFNYIFEFVCATIGITFMMYWVWIWKGMDILHIYNPPDTLFISAILPRLAGKAVIYHQRDPGPELYLSKYDGDQDIIYKILVLLERICCRFATQVIVVNESCQKRMIDQNKLPFEKVTVIRQGPNLDRVKLTAPDLELRSRAKKILVYIGLMAKQDGIDHLLKSLYYLDNYCGYRDWLCLLIGSYDDSLNIEAMAEELGIRDRIWLTGYLPYQKWVPLVSTADIGIEPAPASPINNISTMNKLMDYMALRKPSVAYDLPEHRITCGDSALYAKPNDQKDLAGQIYRLICDPKLCEQLGQLGQERIKSSLELSFQRERLIKLYATITPQLRTIIDPNESESRP